MATVGLACTWRRGLCAVVLLLVVLLAGCQGTGHVELAALNFAEIDPPQGAAPRFSSLEIDRCYWWTDEAGQVWIAMERDKPWLLGPEHFVFQVSLVLEKPPAGRARNYLVSKRELRAVARFGPAESRFVSLAGVVALYREPHDRLRGSYRFQVTRHGRQVLGGWSRAARYLMMGTFLAVHDEERGRRIAEQTEAYGWDRDWPASQPTSQPASDATATRPAVSD